MSIEAGRRMAIVGAAFLLCVRWSSAEEPPALWIGARVRAYVTENSGNEGRSKRLTGRLIGLDEKTLSLETSRDRAAMLVARENVTRLDLSIRRGQRGKGALIGLGVGVATGVLLGLGSGDDEGFCCFTAGLDSARFGLRRGHPARRRAGQRPRSSRRRMNSFSSWSPHVASRNSGRLVRSA